MIERVGVERRERLSPVVLLEFNELSPALMERFMGEGRLQNFKTLYDESHIFTTEAAERAPNLEPWIQWIDVHAGRDYADHGIFYLGEGHRLQSKCLWDVLSDHGCRVWVCGSMNVRYDVPVNGYVLPDPWTTHVPPHPPSLAPYFRFVQRHVLEYTNDRVPLTTADYLRFMAFMAGHGLSPSTILAIVRQLVRERNGRDRWRRAFILDALQFDLFKAVYRRTRPHLSTFFLNSTAHMQHMYWRNMEPDLFTVKPTRREQEEFEVAILAGYQAMDRLIGRIRRLVGDAATIVFCTALSQQPCLLYEDQGGKSFYRPRDFERLLRFAGITAPHQVAPVMSEEFHIHFENAADATAAKRALQTLRVAGSSAVNVLQEGQTLFAGCPIFRALPADSVLEIVDTPRSARFFDLFYAVSGKKSGMHHPDGMLWFRLPTKYHAVHKDNVPLTSIAPTILKMFRIPKPAFMEGEALPCADSTRLAQRGAHA